MIILRRYELQTEQRILLLFLVKYPQLTYVKYVESVEKIRIIVVVI